MRLACACSVFGWKLWKISYSFNLYVLYVCVFFNSMCFLNLRTVLHLPEAVLVFVLLRPRYLLFLQNGRRRLPPKYKLACWISKQSKFQSKLSKLQNQILLGFLRAIHSTLANVAWNMPEHGSSCARLQLWTTTKWRNMENISLTLCLSRTLQLQTCNWHSSITCRRQKKETKFDPSTSTLRSPSSNEYKSFCRSSFCRVLRSQLWWKMTFEDESKRETEQCEQATQTQQLQLHDSTQLYIQNQTNLQIFELKLHCLGNQRVSPQMPYRPSATLRDWQASKLSRSDVNL